MASKLIIVIALIALLAGVFLVEEAQAQYYYPINYYGGYGYAYPSYWYGKRNADFGSQQQQ